MAWSEAEKAQRAKLDAQFEARRKAEIATNARKIDASIAAKKNAAAAKAAAKKTPTADQAAKARRDAITKKAAPTGLQRLLGALGYKWD